MRTILSARRSMLALALGAVSLFAAPVATLAAETFAVDPGHSTVLFRISHLGVSNFYGRFDDPSGTIVVDDADPTKTSFDITLKVDKINSANAKRDDHLKSPDFFAATDYPTITFKSTSVKKGEGTTLDVTGDLTLHGTTKPVTVKLNHLGTATTPMGRRTGFEGTFDIKRSEFGMKGYLDKGIGDDVRLIVSIEGVVPKQ